MKNLLLILPCLVLLNAWGNSHSSGKTMIGNCPESIQLKDSIVRRYLVCQDKHYPLSCYIIKDGYILTVIDSAGNQYKGIVSILDGEKFILANKQGLDTVSLSEVVEIRHLNDGMIFKSIYIGFTALSCMALGGGLAYLGDLDINDPNMIAGIIFTASSALYARLAVYSFEGRHFKCHQWKLRIIQTKGFELKKRYVKYL